MPGTKPRHENTRKVYDPGYIYQPPKRYELRPVSSKVIFDYRVGGDGAIRSGGEVIGWITPDAPT